MMDRASAIEDLLSQLQLQPVFPHEAPVDSARVIREGVHVSEVEVVLWDGTRLLLTVQVRS